MEKLYIILPAYNEEENIEKVAEEWHNIVQKIGLESRLVIIDDGSSDNTFGILEELKKELSQLTILTKSNSGHGATVLFGYKYAILNGADYIFQTDSDGQTLSSEFWEMWKRRSSNVMNVNTMTGGGGCIIGARKGRQDGISRIFVTKVLKLVIFLIFHISVEDANAPFRLMRRDILEKYIPYIPNDFNLSNIILTVLLIKGKEKVEFIPITFRKRQGGKNSINFTKIIKIGVQAIKDFRQINKNIKL
ncbi:glycosyltransferase family 2 protein [Enterocloster bolteae]|uniref:glycosyltransferase family 2 protein n=1 Tax=Enterocloster bolteae TaxID=208479 RepID=UPI002A81E161|nr:glycosyltransferase family 2 protein [Enterocloster bolteae]